MRAVTHALGIVLVLFEFTYILYINHVFVHGTPRVRRSQRGQLELEFDIEISALNSN